MDMLDLRRRMMGADGRFYIYRKGKTSFGTGIVFEKTLNGQPCEFSEEGLLVDYCLYLALPENWDTRFEKLVFEVRRSTEKTISAPLSPNDGGAVGVFKFVRSSPLAASNGFTQKPVSTEFTKLEFSVPEIIEELENINPYNNTYTESIGIINDRLNGNEFIFKNIWFE